MINDVWHATPVLIKTHCVSITFVPPLCNHAYLLVLFVIDAVAIVFTTFRCWRLQKRARSEKGNIEAKRRLDHNVLIVLSALKQRYNVR